MNLNINQTKLVGLTMELDLKTREYKMLCEKFDKLKENGNGKDTEKLNTIKKEFLQNQEEIIEINKQIKELKSIQEKEEQKYNPDNLFKKSKNKVETNENAVRELTIIKNESIFKRILKRIKDLFKIQ